MGKFNTLYKVAGGSTLVLLLLITTINNVFAQTTATDETVSDEHEVLEWAFGMSLRYFALEQENTARQNIGLSARQYIGGDMKNTATLWFEFNY